MKKALIKDMFKEISKSKKRFISIILIVILGVGFYAGIKYATPAMQYTTDKYLDSLEYMDFKLVSEYGITKENVEKIKKETYVEDIMPGFSKDVIAKKNKEDKKEFVVKVNSLPPSANTYINRLNVVEGTLPKEKGEVCIDKRIAENYKLKVGDSIYLQDADYLQSEKFTVKAIANSPLFISVERGSTTLGTGTVAGFAYIVEEEIKQEEYSEVYVTVKNFKAENSFSEVYENKVKKVQERLDNLGEEISKNRLDSVVKEATDKLEDGKKKLADSKKEKEDKEKEARESLEKGKKDIEKADAEIKANERKANKEFANAEVKIKESKKTLQEAEAKLQTEKANFTAKEQELVSGIKALEEGITKADSSIKILEDTLASTNKNITDLEMAIASANENITLLEEAVKNKDKNINSAKEEIAKIDLALQKEGITEEEKNTLLANKKVLEEKIKELESLDNKLAGVIATKSELEKNLEKAKAGKVEIEKNLLPAKKTREELVQKKDALQSTYNTAVNSFKKAESEIANSKKMLSSSQTVLANKKKSAYSKIVSAKASLEDAKKKLANGEEEFRVEIEKANEKINEAELELKDAEEKIKEIKSPQWFTLSRMKNQGFDEYKQNTLKIEAIAKVFPIVFFVVAALVCLTSMTRMVEEQRLQIGTLKSLGYSNFAIMTKYIVYAVVATAVGCVIGCIIGINIIPQIIANSYAIMYSVPAVELPVNLKIPVMASLVAIGVILLSVIFAVRQELKESPAALMRPKAPKKGKRILLEKIPFIWQRLNFSQKVTARNIFRYKKKFYMTIIGIAGCTALVVTGFGIKDSVSALVPKQFGRIFKYDTQVITNENATTKEAKEITDTLEGLEFVEDYSKVKMSSNIVKKAGLEEDKRDREAYVIVPENSSKLQEQISFQNRKTKEPVYFKENSVIVTEKLAKVLEVEVGDTLDIEVEKNVHKNFEITDITENYVGHYVYISKDLYEKTTQEEFKTNMIYLSTKDMTKEKEEMLSTKLLAKDNVLSVGFLSKTRIDLENTFNSLNKIVTILIVAASLLAFVVLYNLSNINISERVRELATIKVLGFYDKEVSDYVVRESRLLTVIGIVIGLVAGFFLEAYIIKTVEVDMVMFMPDIKVISYVYAVLVTVIATWLVNVFVHFTLKKIDMIESLKSVE